MRSLLILSFLVYCLLPLGQGHAKTYHCESLNYRVDTPDTWMGSFAADKESLRLIARRSSELTMTFQVKPVSEGLSSAAIIRQFRSRYESKKKIEPKVVVSLKPSKTRVGKYIAYHYAFRYKNFIQQVFDERTLWFNAKNPSKKELLLFKLQIEGPAKAMQQERESIDYILASFAMVLPKDEAVPQEPPKIVSKDTSRDYGSGESRDSSGGGGGSQSGSSLGNYYTSSSKGDGKAKGSFETSTKRRSLDVSSLYGKRSAKNVAGLMHNAKRIEDPEKYEKARKTFQNRNRRRTAEEKRRAQKYMAGFGGQDVNE